MFVPVVPHSEDRPSISGPTADPRPLTAFRRLYEWRWDMLAGSRMSVQRLRLEPALFQTKWFDYRFAHPAKATEIFATHYSEIYRKMWERHRDKHEAELKRGFSGGGVFESSRHNVSAMVAARQRADAVGLPYDFFIYRGFETLLDWGWGRKAGRQLPRPNQFCTEKLATELLRQWDERLPDLPRYAKHSRFETRNYRNEPVQNQYHEWLIALIRRRASSPRVIGHLCYELDQLPEAKAEIAFGAERLRRAREECPIAVPTASVPHDPECFRVPLGCFGVPHAYSGANEVCQACEHSDGCRTVSEAAIRALRSQFGAEDPVSARKRELARLRQQRSRAKRRSAGAGSTSAKPMMKTS